MRISDRQRYDIAGMRIDKAKTDNANQLEIISTQKRINNISDDPLAAAQVIKLRDRVNRIRQYEKNADYSRGFIESSEAAVNGIHDALMRAKELSVGMANSTYDSESRQAAGREVKQLIDSVVSLGNSSFGDRYVFGGFRTQTPPISNHGLFSGDDGKIFMQLDDEQFQQVNLQARHLFEATPDERASGHFDMIHSLTLLYDGLMSDNDDYIHKAIDELDFQMSKSSSYQATLGAIYNALDSSTKKLELNEELNVGTMSRLEDADIYKSSSDFKRTETVLQSSLMASNKLLQPSLLNFLQ